MTNGTCDRSRRRIDGIDELSASETSGNRESAIVTEEIQHAFPFGYRPDGRSIFTLIEKKSRFLTIHKIDAELHTVLLEGVFLRELTFAVDDGRSFRTSIPRSGFEHGTRKL
jgi:hypothetical protein